MSACTAVVVEHKYDERANRRKCLRRMQAVRSIQGRLRLARAHKHTHMHIDARSRTTEPSTHTSMHCLYPKNQPIETVKKNKGKKIRGMIKIKIKKYCMIARARALARVHNGDHLPHSRTLASSIDRFMRCI